MVLSFEASDVAIEENEFDVLVIGFYAEDNYLIIQQSLDEYDEQDVSLGMNTYHIERDDQSYGGYGGVKQVRLSRKLIEIDLDETGKENLDCDSVRINFETDDETYTLLKEKLKQIFGEGLTVN